MSEVEIRQHLERAAEQHNKLAAKVTVQNQVLASLCRKSFDGSEIANLLAPIDIPPAAGGIDPETAELVNHALSDFRQLVMRPVMGDDV